MGNSRRAQRQSAWGVYSPLVLLAVLVFGTVQGAAHEAENRLPVRPLCWDEVLTRPDGQDLMHGELYRQRMYQSRFRWVHQLLGDRNVSHRSRRWLAERGLGAARLLDPYAKVAVSGVDTLHVLLVRISFETNLYPHLVTMAEDGDFFLDLHDPNDPANPIPIDPTPHDKAYFESHMRGLAEYYHVQSDGRLHIESRVLPEGERDSYKLEDVSVYGPGESDWWTLAALEQMVRDMIRAADIGTQEDGSADLSDYADDHPLTYIIFAHAGSDWQSDVKQDSPNDIPTFFITMGEPEPLIGGGVLSECSIIPETTNQDGYFGSIAAALYHEFGHALGLPDVYDATTGLTSCGVWDLMDSGTNLAAVVGYEFPRGSDQWYAAAVTGLLPPSLSAWCRWFLGWLDTDLIQGGPENEYRLPAVTVPRAQYDLHNTLPGNAFDIESPQVLQGGASPREFFLIENRWVPRSVRDTPYDPEVSGANYGGLYFKRDPQTGVVLYLAGDLNGQEGLNTGYYDYFLPDGGLLVWHVNMDRIEAGLPTNSINRFGDGLRLVEADGIQDIGVLDSYVLGWYGSARDPFAPWNAVGYTELFTQGAGVPNSRAFDRSWTGLRLWDIADDGSAHGAVMSLKATLEPMQPGWPVDLPVGQDDDGSWARQLDVASLVPLALVGRDPLLAVLTTDRPEEPPLLFIWTTDGTPAYPADGDRREDLPDGAVLALSTAASAPPAAIPYLDDSALLIIGTGDGSVQAHEPRRSGLLQQWTVSAGDSLRGGPQPVPLPDGSHLVLVIDDRGQGRLLDPVAGGQIVGEPKDLLGLDPMTALVAPMRILDLADGPAVLLCHAMGWSIHPVGAGGFAQSDPAPWQGELDAPAHVAVVASGDHSHRLLIFGPDGLQGAWLIDPDGGWSETSWPDPKESLVCEPAVADLDGDGRLDVIAATEQRIFAWHADGVSLTGYPVRLDHLFPLHESTRIGGSLIVADLAGGPANELAFVTDRGHLFLLGSDGRRLDGTPYRFGHAGGSGLAVTLRGEERASLVLASAGGMVGPPMERRLTPGRLAFYGDRPVPLDGPATAGWFGRGGGPLRTGPVGQPRPVAGESPADRGFDGVVFYPNPLLDKQLTVRYWSAGNTEADLVIYNLLGEVTYKTRLDTRSGQFNEHAVDLDVASGLYLARLTWERAQGKVSSEVKTLAVTR